MRCKEPKRGNYSTSTGLRVNRQSYWDKEEKSLKEVFKFATIKLRKGVKWPKKTYLEK